MYAFCKNIIVGHSTNVDQHIHHVQMQEIRFWDPRKV